MNTDKKQVIPVSEPAPENGRIEVEFEFLNDGINGAGIYMATTSIQVHPEKFPAIEKAIESVINNDTPL